jgi:hypothetical protein
MGGDDEPNVVPNDLPHERRCGTVLRELLDQGRDEHRRIEQNGPFVRHLCLDTSGEGANALVPRSTQMLDHVDLVLHGSRVYEEAILFFEHRTRANRPEGNLARAALGVMDFQGEFRARLQAELVPNRLRNQNAAKLVERNLHDLTSIRDW